MNPGALLGGRYQLEREVGSGGMARVFQARDTAIDRLVAVKMLREQFGEDHGFRERFLREARAAGRLSHPNIVAVHDVGVDAGQFYLVMQLVDGPTLADEIGQRGRIPIDEAIEIAVQVAEALDYASGQGVVHRDVKPANILLTESARGSAATGNASFSVRRRWALLSDFGIARTIGEAGLSSSNEVFGTVQYLAPERAKGQPATPASDVYSLGVVIYEMVTGHVPYSGDSPVATAIAHIQQPVPPPSSVHRAVPTGVERIILKALAKVPSERYQTAGDLAAALRALQRAGDAPTATLQRVHPEGTVRLTSVPETGRALFAGWRFAALGAIFAVALLTTSVVVLASRGALRLPTIARPTTVPAATPTPAPTPVPQVAVPSVVGLDASAARQTLRTAGFVVKDTEEFSSSVPASKVIRTAPNGGVQRPAGSTVELVVSKGQDTVSVPTLNGAKLADAHQALNAAGLKAVELAEFNDGIAVDVVYNQNPKAGVVVARGSTVTFTVSKGKEKVRVPDVVGKSEADAKRLIEQSRLRNSPYVNVQTRRDLPDQVLRQVCVGCVLSATPRPGDEVEIGSEVSIAVRGE